MAPPEGAPSRGDAAMVARAAAVEERDVALTGASVSLRYRGLRSSLNADLLYPIVFRADSRFGAVPLLRDLL
jgi:hypothetical protein